METIITIILLMAGSAFANWMQRRANKDQEEELGELEEWVGRKEAPPQPPPVSAPRPPPIFKIPDRRASPAPTIPRPATADRRAQAPRIPSPPPLVFEEEGQSVGARMLESLQQAREASKRASEIHRTAARVTAGELARAGRVRDAKNIVPTVKAAEMIRMLRNPASVRKAIVASVLLGPPRCMSQR